MGFLCFIGTYSAQSQCAFSTGTGVDGAFSSTGNTVLAGDTFHYTSFQLNIGHTLTFSTTNPVVIYCQGSFIVDGTLDVSGQAGGNSDNGGVPGPGGLGGPGGSNGGVGGGAGAYNPYHPDNGSGPGGGIGGISIDRNDGLGGGGGGFGTPGGDAVFIYDTAAFGTGYGLGGPAYGDMFLTILQGGSGGGGGGADYDGGAIGGDDPGGGGGGGGGAIKIGAATFTVNATGQILANGGVGGSTGNGGSGGGGSGGAIFVQTNNATNNGVISAVGGVSLFNQYATSEGGTGGEGRIVFNTTVSGAGSVSPSAATGTTSSSYTLITGCYSATFGGNTYTSSTVLIDTLAGQGSGGCDSLVITDIQIKTPTVSNSTQSGCDSVFYNGTMYYSSTTINDTIAGVSCDSVVYVTNIVVGGNVSSTNTVITCDTSGININGNIYYSDTTVTDTLTGGAFTGCDSIVTTTLMITNFSQGNISLTDCDSVMVFGNTYMSSTTARDTLIGGAAAGCDSITVATITIGTSSTTNNVTLNSGETLTVGSNTYSTSGTYVDTLMTSAGCDSIITTVLTVTVDGISGTIVKGLKVYPNPMVNQLVIQAEVSLTSIRIMDIEGRELMAINPNSLSTSIETNALTSGLYLFEVTDHNGNVSIGKVIKK